MQINQLRNSHLKSQTERVMNDYCERCMENMHEHEPLTLKVLVTTIDALRHF